MSRVLLFSLAAAFYPTLLAATMVMLVLPHPQRLMLGYLLGALTTSVTLGLLIVFWLGGSSSATITVKDAISPVFDLVLGALVLVIVFVVATGRDTWRRERSARRRAARADKGPPKWKRKLSGGTARTTFVIGALADAAGHLLPRRAGRDRQAGSVRRRDGPHRLGINVIMLMLLELALIGYTVSPDKATGRSSGAVRG